MAIKKDGTGKRWVEMEITVPGTPEQVWHAMATGPGNAAWFTPATIEERVGGELKFDFGAGSFSKGEVTAWEPPRRFGYVEREWAQGAPPVATEITVTASAGGTCAVRMVHSLFASTDDWDDQMEGFEQGWPAFFDVLRLYLGHFAGQRAASFQATATIEGDQAGAWTRLTTALGLTHLVVGEHRTTSPSPETLAGVIERVQQDRRQELVMMRLDESPSPGVAMLAAYGIGEGRVNVGIGLYLYGDDAQSLAASSEPRWRAWLEETFVRARTTS